MIQQQKLIIVNKIEQKFLSIKQWQEIKNRSDIEIAAPVPSLGY